MASTQNNELKRHEDLWFDDGNIVIIAENIGFRVYRGILSKKSELFKDLFTLPQPEGSEAIDGCPVVRLQDSAADWGRFLSALFDGARMWKNNKYNCWSLTRSIIDISNKYQIDDLRDEAAERLRERFPDQIEDWDKLYDTDADMLGKLSDVISMANAARLLELHDVHARALYDCAQLTTDKLLLGVENEDGVREVLCTDDLKVCIDARKTLAREHVKLFFARSSEQALTHTNNTKCIAARKRLSEICQQHAKELDHDPLAPDDEFDRILDKMCKACAKHHRRKDDKARQHLLTKLPTCLGLESKPPSDDTSSDDESDSDSSSSSSSSHNAR